MDQAGNGHQGIGKGGGRGAADQIRIHDVDLIGADRLKGGKAHPPRLFLGTDAIFRTHDRDDDQIWIQGKDLFRFHRACFLLAGDIDAAPQFNEIMGEGTLYRGEQRMGADLEKNLAARQRAHRTANGIDLAPGLINKGYGVFVPVEYCSQSKEMIADILKGSGLAKGLDPQRQGAQLLDRLRRGQVAGQDQLGVQADDLLETQFLDRTHFLDVLSRFRSLTVDGVADQAVPRTEQKNVFGDQGTERDNTLIDRVRLAVCGRRQDSDGTANQEQGKKNETDNQSRCIALIAVLLRTQGDPLPADARQRATRIR